MHFDVMHRKGHVTSVMFPPRTFNLNVNIRKQSDKTKLRNVLYKTHRLNSSKTSLINKENKTKKSEESDKYPQSVFSDWIPDRGEKALKDIAEPIGKSE